MKGMTTYKSTKEDFQHWRLSEEDIHVCLHIDNTLRKTLRERNSTIRAMCTLSDGYVRGRIMAELRKTTIDMDVKIRARDIPRKMINMKKKVLILTRKINTKWQNPKFQLKQSMLLM